MTGRRRALAIAAGVSGAVALFGAIGTFFAEGPYLSVSKGIEPWVAVWALGLFGLFACLPFALHDRARPSERNRDRQWEVAVVGWGAVALAAALGALALVWAGPGPSHPLGVLALVLLIEAGAVVCAVAAVVLGT